MPARPECYHAPRPTANEFRARTAGRREARAPMALRWLSGSAGQIDDAEALGSSRRELEKVGRGEP